MARLNTPGKVTVTRPLTAGTGKGNKAKSSGGGQQTPRGGSLKLNAGAAPKLNSKSKKKAQKARDASARDGLDGSADALRAAMLADGKPEAPVEKPTELLGGGDGLAALMSAGM